MLVFINNSTITLCKSPEIRSDLQAFFKVSEEPTCLIDRIIEKGVDEKRLVDLPTGEIAAFILAKLVKMISSHEPIIIAKKFRFSNQNPVFGI